MKNKNWNLENSRLNFEKLDELYTNLPVDSDENVEQFMYRTLNILSGILTHLQDKKEL